MTLLLNLLFDHFLYVYFIVLLLLCTFMVVLYHSFLLIATRVVRFIIVCPQGQLFNSLRTHINPRVLFLLLGVGSE